MSSNGDNLGGGSGGGPVPGPMDHSRFLDGRYAIAANQVELLSRPPMPPSPPGPSIITVAATDLVGMQGEVDIRGAAAVRITAGPPMLPPTNTGSTQGIEIVVGELQNVTIQRGMLPGVDQKIEMTPSGITVNAGAMPITLQSLTQITLSVAGGLSTITLGPQGVTIQGVLVQIN